MELCPGVTLRDAATPFLPEDPKESPHGKPLVADSKIAECPHCLASFPPGRVYGSLEEFEKSIVERRKQREEHIARIKTEEDKNRGELAPVAASIVMKILYRSRFVRMDLLRVIGSLA